VKDRHSITKASLKQHH